MLLYLSQKHSINIGEDTLESIRIVKDFLVQSGGQKAVEISQAMIDKCKTSRSSYAKYLDEKKKQEADHKKRKDDEVISLLCITCLFI